MRHSDPSDRRLSLSARPWLALAILALAASGWLACSSGDLEDKEGTVELIVSEFDGLPAQASVNALAAGGGLLVVDEITLQNVPRDTVGQTSALQDIQLETVEFTYTRGDSGTRRPPPRINAIFGTVPVGGTDTIDGLPVLGLEQLLNPPLSDLLFENGAEDTETGSELIVLDINMRFFGRTVAGNEISSPVASFRVEFLP